MAPAALAAFRASELSAVQLPYIIIAAMVLFWAVLVAVVKFPPVDQPRGSEGGFAGLAKFPRYWLGVIAQFAYVGAQVGVWSFLIRYNQFNFPGTLEKQAVHWLPISFAIFFAGRFIGTALMTRLNPAKLLAAFAAVNVVLCLTAVAFGGLIGLAALIASSFFMSIMFPTIFTMSLRGLGVYTKSGSAFLVMAIIGGAVFTALMGWISRDSSINTAYVVPAFCFAIVFMFAWVSRRAAPEAASA
jgi:FHS family L-fucose permease-like MFS transporter